MSNGLANSTRDHKSLSHEALVTLLRDSDKEGIRISFWGKDAARTLARRVQPRRSRRLAKYSCGSEDDQAPNAVIEGENLQAMVTMYLDRGQVDLIVADPPYNTGMDFRYNDRWDEDPNDPGIGDVVRRALRRMTTRSLSNALLLDQSEGRITVPPSRHSDAIRRAHLSYPRVVEDGAVGAELVVGPRPRRDRQGPSARPDLLDTLQPSNR
ncbi:MAG: hypothetical protein ABIO99_03715 [Candidatus Limnocylindria bacterium]